MYYIGQNKLHMCHALISTIQESWEKCARHIICSRKMYKGHSHEFYMAIILSLGDYMPHHS